MAMVVKNNMSAVSTLNTLNKNSSALQKSLSKVSSGMKINSAQDDASGYAISERMRVQIRSLDQANQNTQNGASMMKTAEGAVSSTVEILKSLKEKAINSANDTNTDSDRATIQKEIDQFIDQIDDNALTTFNGKYLVDGSKNTVGQETYTALTNQNLSTNTTGETALTALKNRNDESLEIDSTDKVTVSFVQNGETYSTVFQVGNSNLNSIFNAADSLKPGTFAGKDNASVKKAMGSEATEETSSSSSSTIGDYTKDALQAKSDEYEAALADDGSLGQAVADTAGRVGKITVTAGALDDDVSKTYGAAAELARALDEVMGDATLSAVAAAGTDSANPNGIQDANFKQSDFTGSISTSLQSGSAIAGADQDAIKNAITALRDKGTDAASEAANKLETALNSYNEAVDAKTEAKSAYDKAAANKATVDAALKTIETKEKADTAAAGLADDIKVMLDAFAHPEGTVSATEVPLKNSMTVGITEVASTTAGTGGNAATVTMKAAGSATKIGSYSDDNEALSNLASSMADKIVENVEKYGGATTDANGVLASGSAAETIVKEMTAGLTTGSDPSTAPATAFDYTKLANADASLKFDSTGDGVNDQQIKAMNTAATAKVDINGYGKAYAEYANAKALTDVDGFDEKLSKAMGSTTSGGSVQLLTGKEVGVAASSKIQSTVNGEAGVTVTAAKAGIEGQIAGLNISITDSEGNVKKAANASLDKFSETVRAQNASSDNALSFQIGADANVAIKVGLTDMRSEALGLKGSDGSKVSVATQTQANAAVNVFDNAIQKAIDQQTTIGAIEARLEYTSQNLTTSSENVQAAESTIRDADMAKEMTNYTKNNVLLQAAQSMLAQANQSSSAVLSLLQ